MQDQFKTKISPSLFVTLLFVLLLLWVVIGAYRQAIYTFKEAGDDFDFLIMGALLAACTFLKERWPRFDLATPSGQTRPLVFDLALCALIASLGLVLAYWAPGYSRWYTMILKLRGEA